MSYSFLLIQRRTNCRIHIRHCIAKRYLLVRKRGRIHILSLQRRLVFIHGILAAGSENNKKYVYVSALLQNILSFLHIFDWVTGHDTNRLRSWPVGQSNFRIDWIWSPMLCTVKILESFESIPPSCVALVIRRIAAHPKCTLLLIRGQVMTCRAGSTP